MKHGKYRYFYIFKTNVCFYSTGKMILKRFSLLGKGKFLYPLIVIAIIILVMPPFVLKKMLSGLGNGETVAANYGEMIVVYGAGMISEDYWRNSTVERIDAAADLYLERPRKLVISEGNLNDTVLFKKMISARFREKTGLEIPVIYDFKSRNTYQNCKRADSIAIAHGVSELILVTSLYHQRRVKMIADKTISVSYKIASMDPGGKYQMENWRDWQWCRKRVLREFAALAKDYMVLKFRNENVSGSKDRQME